ncbi:MAG: nickel transporter [Rhodospirillaceae bacterium]|nr:nickel transporter [Rhodospirillaceae bacterium]
MKLIPVLDLMGGQVVHASGGHRAAYRPLETSLCEGSDPLAVCLALLGLHSFSTIYLADLDQIEGRGGNEDVISALEAAFPDVEFWVDGGLSEKEGASPWLARHSGGLVVGSESQKDVAFLQGLMEGDETRLVLSLDFRQGDFLGPEDLLDMPALWPCRVIVMSLGRIGGDSGPDYDLLAGIAAKAAKRSELRPVDVIAAGGVRGVDDLIRLKRQGVAGILLASALYDGRICGADIRALIGE